jgi:hypothetical protein
MDNKITIDMFFAELEAVGQKIDHDHDRVFWTDQWYWYNRGCRNVYMHDLTLATISNLKYGYAITA